MAIEAIAIINITGNLFNATIQHSIKLYLTRLFCPCFELFEFCEPPDIAVL